MICLFNKVINFKFIINVFCLLGTFCHFWAVYQYLL